VCGVRVPERLPARLQRLLRRRQRLGVGGLRQPS
jgi:hypothetical protein